MNTTANRCLRGRVGAVLLVTAAAAALGSCGGSKAPTGQVVATVDGEEITRRDLASELRALRAPVDKEVPGLEPILVDRIVARKLLVAQARREGIDKTPEYLAAELRMRESLLASMLAERWASQVPVPTSSAIQAFIADNPHMFGNRQILTIDQIRTPAAGIDLKALAPLNTNDAVVALLNSRKHGFERSRATLDTLALPKRAAEQIAALPSGMPFVVNQGGMLTIGAVVGTRPMPIPEAQQATVATAAIKRAEAGKTLSSQLSSLRLAGKIQYQPGFAPPDTPALRKPAS